MWRVFCIEIYIKPEPRKTKESPSKPRHSRDGEQRATPSTAPHMGVAPCGSPRLRRGGGPLPATALDVGLPGTEFVLAQSNGSHYPEISMECSRILKFLAKSFQCIYLH